jgi:hypothetical protein
MPQVEFEPTIQALKRAKTVDALDGAATAIGNEEHRPRLYKDNYLIIREVRTLSSLRFQLLLKHRKDLPFSYTKISA